jgi:phosphatidate phosphatase LPIN
MTFAAFQRHLPRAALSSLYEGGKRPNDPKATESGATSGNGNGNGGGGGGGGGYSSWFSWRRSSQPAKKSPNSSFGKSESRLSLS